MEASMEASTEEVGKHRTELLAKTRRKMRAHFAASVGTFVESLGSIALLR